MPIKNIVLRHGRGLQGQGTPRIKLTLTVVVFADTLSLGEHFILEPVAAMAAAQANFLNIPLINREDLAGTGATHPIDKTFSLRCQCGTGKKQIAAGSALPAVAPADRKLGLNVLFFEMNQPEAPDLSGAMKNHAAVGENPDDSTGQPVKGGRQNGSPAGPSMYI